MTEILGTPNLARRAANQHGFVTGLCGELGRACLAHAEKTPQQAAENPDVGLEP